MLVTERLSVGTTHGEEVTARCLQVNKGFLSFASPVTAPLELVIVLEVLPASCL